MIGPEETREVIARVAEVAERRGCPMAHVALAWLWARGSSSVLVGCSKPSRVDDAVAALATELTDDEAAYLEEPYAAPRGRGGAIKILIMRKRVKSPMY